MKSVTVTVAVGVLRVVRMSRFFGDSIVRAIAGIGAAVSVERVRDGLGSESHWYSIASDNAANSNAELENFSFESNNKFDVYTSSDDRVFAFKILEEGERVFRCDIPLRRNDRLKSSSLWISVWVHSSILVEFLKRVELIAFNIFASLERGLIIRSVLIDHGLEIEAVRKHISIHIEH